MTLNPPFLPKFSRSSFSAVASGTLYYPMWLAYATGILRRLTTKCFIDAPATNLSLEQVIQKTIDFGPKWQILDTSTPSIYDDIEVGIALKKAVPSLLLVLVESMSQLYQSKHLNSIRNRCCCFWRV